MLKEAIDELKGEVKQEAVTPVEINLQLDAYIPSMYITDSRQKIEMYKKFVAVSTLEDVDDLAEELLDRFGPVPQPVDNLLTISRLRVYALQHHITEISQKIRMKSSSFSILAKTTTLMAVRCLRLPATGAGGWGSQVDNRSRLLLK